MVDNSDNKENSEKLLKQFEREVNFTKMRNAEKAKSLEMDKEMRDVYRSINEEIQEELDRSLKISRTNTMTSTEFTTSATDRADKVLSFNGSGELAVTQELGTFKGNSATTTTAAFTVRDIVKATTTAQLNNIYKVMDTVLTGSAQNVVVHCAMGMERSVLSVVWYLANKNNMTLKRSLELVQSKRAIAQDRLSWILT